MIAQRTGRTVAELMYGSPTVAPLSVGEYAEWLALLTIVEPFEKEEAQRNAKNGT